jgi:hypothetical protein
MCRFLSCIMPHVGKRFVCSSGNASIYFPISTQRTAFLMARPFNERRQRKTNFHTKHSWSSNGLVSRSTGFKLHFKHVQTLVPNQDAFLTIYSEAFHDDSYWQLSDLLLSLILAASNESDLQSPGAKPFQQEQSCTRKEQGNAIRDESKSR